MEHTQVNRFKITSEKVEISLQPFSGIDSAAISIEDSNNNRIEILNVPQVEIQTAIQQYLLLLKYTPTEAENSVLWLQNLSDEVQRILEKYEPGFLEKHVPTDI
jgi:hypothetical protein